MIRLLLFALASALMAAATVVYITHRRPEVSAPLYRDWDEAEGMCPNCLTPWRCNGPHEPMFV